jgi:hypothetical protein
VLSVRVWWAAISAVASLISDRLWYF